jgi:hypothetical protein
LGRATARRPLRSGRDRVGRQRGLRPKHRRPKKDGLHPRRRINGLRVRAPREPVLPGGNAIQISTIICRHCARSPARAVCDSRLLRGLPLDRVGQLDQEA